MDVLLVMKLLVAVIFATQTTSQIVARLISGATGCLVVECRAGLIH